ncbi:MAG: GDSL-type esterase/lipase family protein [Crocinitomicaceae bacterium]
MLNKITALFFLVSAFLIGSIHNGYAQANPCIASSTYKIVVLGSSTAAGTGPSTSDSTWVNRYRNYLQSINPGNEVVNLAVGGYNTYRIMPTGFIPPPNRPNPDVARNITAALAESPNAIIVNMPSNDVAGGFSYAEQMFNLDTIVQIANAASVPIWICTTQPRNFSTAQAQLQWDLKDSILSIFAPNTIDFWTTIATPSYFIDPLYDSGDGVHLNDAGHNILESRVISANILQNVYVPIANPDPAIVSIHPVTQSVCGDSIAQFEYDLINFGPNDSLDVVITSELSHQPSGTSVSDSETLTDGLPECSTQVITFEGSTYQQGSYTLTVIVSSVTNSNTSNDTLVYTFNTSGHPTWTAHNDTLCNPDFATLSVTSASQDTVLWYTDAVSPTPIGYGNVFPTPLINASTDWYAEVVRGDLHYSDKIFTTNNSAINWNGTMFDLIGHENIEIDSFDIKINTIGTQDVEIYQKAGSYLGYELDANAWTLVDIVSVDVIDPTIQTHVPFSGFSIAQDDTVGVYLTMADPNADLSYINSGSPQTRSTNELTMITGSGVSNNFSNSYYPRDWNGRVYYHFGERLQGDCSSGRFPVTAYLSDIPFETIQDTIIDIQDTLIITSTTGLSSYEWMDGSTGSTFEFIASQFGNGIHFVTVSAFDSLGCFHLDTVVVGVADLVSTQELSSSISVFPNPTTGVIQFSDIHVDEVEIFTLDGKQIEAREVINGTLDLSELKSGFYLIRITLHGHNQVIKILKRDL